MFGDINLKVGTAYVSAYLVTAALMAIMATF